MIGPNPCFKPHSSCQVIRVRDPHERPKPVPRHMTAAVNTRIAAAATMPLSEVSQNVLIKVKQMEGGVDQKAHLREGVTEVER